MLQGSLLFLISLFIQLPISGQYTISHYTTSNGLPSNGIKGLQWDDTTGFLWIGTEAGLLRFNGLTFKVLDISTHPDFGSNRLLFVKKNNKGQILVATESGNLLSVAENDIYTLRKDSGYARNNYNRYAAIEVSDTLAQHCYQNPWPKKGFSIYSNTAVAISDTACLTWSNGNLYYFSLSNPSLQLLPVPGFSINRVFKSASNFYCFTKASQVFAYDVEQQKMTRQELIDEHGKPLTLKTYSNFIWENGMEFPLLVQDGNAWILETKDLAHLQLKQVASGLPADTYFRYAWYEKRSGYLFLGSYSKGLYISQPDRLTIKKPSTSSPFESSAVYGQVELPNGNVITDRGKVIGDQPTRDSFNLGKGFSKRIFSINPTELVYARKDSILNYDKKHYSETLLFKTTYTEHDFAYIQSGGRNYFLSHTGIGTVKDGKLVNEKLLEEGIPGHHTSRNMIELEPGKLLLSTCNYLLLYETGSRKLDTILYTASNCIRDLHKEGKYILISTYGGGYYVLKDGVIFPMPMDTRKYLKYTHCFIKDAADFIWISTNNGLFKAALSDIIESFEFMKIQKGTIVPPVYYHYFGPNDGLEATELNGGCTPCAIQLKNGQFSFPTMEGLLWFDPLSIREILPAGEIYVDKYLLDGNELSNPPENILYLPSRPGKLDIVLGVNAWSKRENLYMEYKLDQGDWHPLSIVAGEPRLEFINLDYGKHNLQIRKLNGYGINNFSYRNILLDVHLPFYRQWWFQLLAVLAISGMITLYAFYQLRQSRLRETKLAALVAAKTKDLQAKNEQLEKNDEIKTRLISVINHDVITPLKFMNYAGKALLESKRPISSEEQLKTIAEITQTAKELELLSSQVLNWIIYQQPEIQMQREEFDLHKLVAAIFRTLQFSAKQKKLQLLNEVPAPFMLYQYMELIQVIIYNLVLNSINFTKQGSISVSSSREENNIVIEVKDTGVGMTEEQINNILSDERTIAAANASNRKGTGLGYEIIKDLLKIVKGRLNIISNKNLGTTVQLILPIDTIENNSV
jgi:signal transduction histidine kinase